jgi:hypothetical protein
MDLTILRAMDFAIVGAMSFAGPGSGVVQATMATPLAQKLLAPISVFPGMQEEIVD